MATWRTLDVAASNLDVEIGDLLRWIRQGEIIYSKLPGKLMVDVENLSAFLDDNRVVSIEAIIRKKLRKREEKIIRKATGHFYDDHYYEQLQMKGFALSPIVLKALATLIDDKEKREIFTSIMNGETLCSIGARLHCPVEAILSSFNATVTWLESEVERTYASQQEAYDRLDQICENLRLELDWRKKVYMDLLEKYVHLRDKAEGLKKSAPHKFLFWKKLLK